MAWLTATYLMHSEPERIEARAEALASEQSVECPLEAVRDQRIRDEVVARVAEIVPAGDGRYRVDVRIAVETTCYEPAQLMNMVFGNCSLWEDVQLVDFDLPQALLARFGGPRHGIAGIRALVDAPRRALTSVAMKPQGLPAAELARMCRTFALAGIDIIKDDHGIANQPCSPFAERVPACQAAIAHAVAATGKPSFYAPHLIGTPRVLRERARIARDAGVRVVLVAPMVVGLPAFADLVDEFPDFVYLAHPSFGGAARIAPPLLFGRIFRLLGADAPIFVNYGGRFAYTQVECGALAAATRAEWGAVRPALPVPAGGMRLDRVDELLDFYGPDTMLLIGGNLLLAEGDALLARAREFVSSVDRSSSRETHAAP
ncbi:MAG: RuBisCO large subunit C-terminal-like domain-containing protein [Candidatus Eremiobacteraeota bacterium]|nr:RuBisCO large subunit C-terminal-like domain-containing protein [Candidatus Eremiobacteraeota bacterium]